MRKSLLLLSLSLALLSGHAQWTQHDLKYKYTKEKDFFIPVALHFADTANGFMLNNDHLLQYKNFRWNAVAQNGSDTFTYTCIFSPDPVNVFLGSYDGKFAQYKGDSTTVLFRMPGTEESPAPAFNAIFMIDSAHGWAAGDNGTLLKIDGTTCTQQSFSGSDNINFKDIFFDQPGHGWMIGYTQTDIGKFGVVCEYENNQWSVFSYLDETLYDIEFSSAGNGFITGQQGIYHFNAASNEWQQENIPNYYPQYHLSMLNDSYGISVSDNSSNMLYENGTWSNAPAADVADLVDIKTMGIGNAWAISQVGNNDPANLNEGKIQLMKDNHWNDHSIKYLDSTFILPVDFAINNLSALNRKNIWINGQYLQLPATGNWYDTVPILGTNVFCTVSRIFSNSFGLATDGGLLQWDGAGWLNRQIDPSNPDTSIINLSMHVFDDTTAFVCRQILVWNTGEFKSVISLYNNRSNSLLNTTVLDTRSTLGIHFSDRKNGWCVGDSGLVAKYSNAGWQILNSFTENRLNSIFTIDSSKAWIAGDHGQLYKYNGQHWVLQPLPTQQNLNAIYFTDSSHGWIAGDSGIIFKYNGVSWQRDTGILSTNALHSIYMVDSSYGFVGGDDGIFLQYIRPKPITPPNLYCQGNTIYYTYQPSGENYQYRWQVNSGTQFENLEENATYSGVRDDTLWIRDMPAHFAGYQYRCVASANGIDSISEVKRLAFINEWTGAVDSTWENPANWTCGSLPGATTDVIINHGTVFIKSAVAIKSLTVHAGVGITIAEGGDLKLLK